MVKDEGDVKRLTCSDCKRPFLEISGGQVKILSRHGSDTHENTLTLNDLRMIELEIYRQLYPTGKW